MEEEIYCKVLKNLVNNTLNSMFIAKKMIKIFIIILEEQLEEL